MYKFPDIKGFVRLIPREYDGAIYVRNNGFGCIDSIGLIREGVRIITGDEAKDEADWKAKPVWTVMVSTYVQGRALTQVLEQTIEELAEQINNS